MKKIFQFGEKVKGYDIRVLNEREVRAASGLFFVVAMMAFMNVWLIGDLNLIKIFIITFLLDFIIRVFINPKYAPSLVLGRLIVRNQKPEYVGAPQKRFAWAVGLILSTTMFFMMIVNSILGPVNFLICLACLIFLLFESAFGICLGCMVYNLFHKDKAKLCPGGVCEVVKKEKIQKITLAQIIILLLSIAFIVSIFQFNIVKLDKVEEDSYGASCLGTTSLSQETIVTEVEPDCEIPDWVKTIGHEEQYKLHQGCK